jgi:3-oxoacyl-[acyl-carrier-protein] synthase-3
MIGTIIKDFSDLNILKPEVPIGISSLHIAYPQRIQRESFVLLQDILSPAEFQKDIHTKASITIKNSKNEMITADFEQILKLAETDSAAQLIALNFPKANLKAVASANGIPDWRLIVSGFDPYIKSRNDKRLLNIISTEKPENAAEICHADALHASMKKSFGTENLFMLRDDETITDLMRRAFSKAKTGIDSSEISEVIISTLTPYNVYKGAKGAVALNPEKKSEFCQIPILEIHEGCIGYLQILKIVTLMCSKVGSKGIMGITGDALASISGSDWKCRGLSSDGATASLFRHCEKGYGILGVCSFNIPALHNIITEDQLSGGLLMDGPAICRAITEYYPTLVRNAIKAFGFDKKRVKIISHQMNGSIISKLHDILNIDNPADEPKIIEDQIVNNFHRYGNSSSSTIPTALYQTLKDQNLKVGDELLLIALGSGFNMGFAGYRVNKELVNCF